MVLSAISCLKYRQYKDTVYIYFYSSSIEQYFFNLPFYSIRIVNALTYKATLFLAS